VKRIYIFDFDGTLIKKDSMFLFVKSLYPFWLFFYVINITLIIYYIMYLTRIISRPKLKLYFLHTNFFFFSKNYIDKKSIDFANIIIPKFYYRDALNYIEKINKNEAVIVTASLDLWMQNISKSLQIDLICTETAWDNGIFSGFLEKNCWGKEKLFKLKYKLNIEEYDEIHVFGDSEGDNYLFSIADKVYYKYFKK
jgi:phosphatidylglycerophosphatase C